MYRHLIFILVALGFGCNKDSLLVDTMVSSLPAEVRLHPGQSILLPREGYALTFERVTADSRCPVGAECLWAGDGAVWLKIQNRAGMAGDDTLHTTLNPKSLEFQSLTVRLKNLEPYPVYNEPLDSSKYVAVLAIDKITPVPQQTE